MTTATATVTPTKYTLVDTPWTPANRTALWGGMSAADRAEVYRNSAASA